MKTFKLNMHKYKTDCLYTIFWHRETVIFGLSYYKIRFQYMYSLKQVKRHTTCLKDVKATCYKSMVQPQFAPSYQVQYRLISTKWKLFNAVKQDSAKVTSTDNHSTSSFTTLMEDLGWKQLHVSKPRPSCYTGLLSSFQISRMHHY